ncbi:hypothetical protein SAMN06297251_10438 [Fulvimarina manganoxydans]|uniref:Uncharacterized protein n=2 Tax=Fulvimarina manganoxydans TaxID=937218 RepID=A0A1W2A908_9HYPH|nr:hypothetical protein SAMN06297251_10438 [Fulvimarina manganoxydans]
MNGNFGRRPRPAALEDCAVRALLAREIGGRLNRLTKGRIIGSRQALSMRLDISVKAVDELNAFVRNRGEIDTFSTARALVVAERLGVPVRLVVGEQDEVAA